MLLNAIIFFIYSFSLSFMIVYSPFASNWKNCAKKSTNSFSLMIIKGCPDSIACSASVSF
uniref:Uncharacterized protein n=1 Tax=Lactococcus lactis TaxID=1358 RepID=Q9K2N5_9LACT|nr:unknown [Lactococcus lactis]AAF27557.1 unknown [Lactococcus lactis]